MAIELLDMNKQWAKIKAGMNSGPFWKMPARGPNPKSFSDGPEAMTRMAQMSNMPMKSGGVFTGKTFSQRRG